MPIRVRHCSGIVSGPSHNHAYDTLPDRWAIRTQVRRWMLRLMNIAARHDRTVKPHKIGGSRYRRSSFRFFSGLLILILSTVVYMAVWLRAELRRDRLDRDLVTAVQEQRLKDALAILQKGA